MGASSKGSKPTQGVREGLSVQMKLFKGIILLSFGIGFKKTGIHHPAGGNVLFYLTVH